MPPVCPARNTSECLRFMPFENAGSVEEMMLYTELQSAVHAMIQRLEYSFTFNPSLLISPKRKQQVGKILEEAEGYIWRIKEEMRCA